jgi:hypothetical protein
VAGPLVERRAHPRVAIDLPVDVAFGDLSYVSRSTNLSLEGLAVIVPGAPLIRPGAQVEFGINLHYLDVNPLRVEGTAVVLRVDGRREDRLLALRAQWFGTTPAGAVDSAISARVLRGNPCN